METVSGWLALGTAVLSDPKPLAAAHINPQVACASVEAPRTSLVQALHGNSLSLLCKRLVG